MNDVNGVHLRNKLNTGDESIDDTDTVTLNSRTTPVASVHNAIKAVIGVESICWVPRSKVWLIMSSLNFKCNLRAMSKD